jgi:isoleucyl-tRNA synthetase
VHRADALQARIVAAYARYDFADIVQALSNFCSVELGSLYLDVTKDRLYTMPEDSHGRRSAQSAMYRIAEAFARWIAPILSFTADEIWGFLPGERVDNVLFATWYDGLAPLPHDAALSAADFDELLALREQIAKVLEPMRVRGTIGAALEAEITISADASKLARWQLLAGELRFLFISGDVSLASGEVDEPSIVAEPSGKPKCGRCWHHQADVGADPRHPELCGRCVGNVEGPGEHREWF